MMNGILSFLTILAAIISTSFCADPFESYILRLNCYPSTQPGCHTEFVDAYPELGWSVTKYTRATTYFHLFTKDNPDVPELLHKCAGELPPDTKFNPECRTEIFLPGFTSGACNLAIFRELKNERLKSGCYNVILVDYTWGNHLDLYVAKLNLKIVAKQLVIVIRNIKNRYNLTEDHFILTGHSLGCHLAGYVGQDEPIGIINAVEPSILLPENTPLDDRLDASDAKCVQVMHCNAGDCLPRYMGSNYTLGTVHFWINGGSHQHSCQVQTLKAFIKRDYLYAFFSLLPSACSHFQCLQYYKASMNPTDCQFVGVKCKTDAEFQLGACRDCGANGENCAVMGAYSCDCPRNGGQTINYHLNTKLLCPYCDNSRINTQGYSCPATII